MLTLLRLLRGVVFFRWRLVVQSASDRMTGQTKRETAPPASPMSPRPSVLLVGPFPNRQDDGGGVGTFLTNLCTSGVGRKYRLCSFSTQRPAKKAPRRVTGYGTLLRAGLAPAFQSVAATLWHVLIFPFFLVRSRARIVQVHTSSFWTFWESGGYVLLARLLGRTVVLRYGGASREFFRGGGLVKREALRLVFRLAHRLIVQSKSWATFFAEWVPSGRIVILPNSVCADDFAGRSPQVGKQRVVVLFLGGQEAHRKGLEDLLAVIETVIGHAPNAEFHIVANPDDVWTGVAERCRGHVRVDASVRGSAKYRAFAEADIFALPSHAEGFPNALLEAMAAGLAIVVTPVGAVPEVVREPRNGFLITPGDREALAQRILELVCDGQTRRRMGEANRADVREHYDRDRVFARLEELYEELLGVST